MNGSGHGMGPDAAASRPSIACLAVGVRAGYHARSHEHLRELREGFGADLDAADVSDAMGYHNAADSTIDQPTVDYSQYPYTVRVFLPQSQTKFKGLRITYWD